MYTRILISHIEREPWRFCPPLSDILLAVIAITAAQPLSAGGLTEADCDCSRIVGRCIVAVREITQRFVPTDPTKGMRDPELHWNLDVRVQPDAQCAKIAVTVKGGPGFQDYGSRALGSEREYQRIVPNGGQLIIRDFARVNGDYYDKQPIVRGHLEECQLCAIRKKEEERKEETRDKSAAREADEFAEAMGIGGGAGKGSGGDTADSMMTDIDEWEEQQRQRERQEQAERERQAREAAAQEAQRRAAMEEQARYTPPPDQGSGWGDAIGAIGAVVGGAALGYLAAKEGIALPSPSMPPPAASSGMSPECEAVARRSQQVMAECERTMPKGSICQTHRHWARCMGNIEAMAGNCAAIRTEVRESRLHSEQAARQVCIN